MAKHKLNFSEKESSNQSVQEFDWTIRAEFLEQMKIRVSPKSAAPGSFARLVQNIGQDVQENKVGKDSEFELPEVWQDKHGHFHLAFSARSDVEQELYHRVQKQTREDYGIEGVYVDYSKPAAQREPSF